MGPAVNTTPPRVEPAAALEFSVRDVRVNLAEKVVYTHSRDVYSNVGCAAGRQCKRNSEQSARRIECFSNAVELQVQVLSP